MSAESPPGAAFLPRLGSAVLAAAAVSLALLAATQLWQVLGRYLFNETPGWTETVSILLMNCAMVFGAAAGVQRGAHFGFTLGLELLPAAAARIVGAAGELLICSIGAALAWHGFGLMLDTWSVKAAGAPLPQGLVYLPLACGGMLIVLFAASRALARWRAAEQGT